MRNVRSAVVRTLFQSKARVAGVVSLIAAAITVYGGTHMGLGRIESTTDKIYKEQRLFDLEIRIEAEEKSTLRDEKTLIQAVPGISAATWRLLMPGTIEYAPERVSGLAILAVSPMKRPAVSDVLLIEGEFLEPGLPERVVIDKTFALDHGLKIGSRVKLRSQNTDFEATIGGIGVFPELLVASVDDHMTMPVRGSVAGVLASQELIQKVFGGKPVNSLVVKLAPGPPVMNREKVLEALKKELIKDEAIITTHVLPELQYSVWCHDNRLTTFRDFLPVVIGVFLGLTFLVLILVIQRLVQAWRKEIATLVAYGASSAGIAFGWLGAVATLNLIGGALGVMGALILSDIVANAYAEGMGFPIIGPDTAYWSVAWAFGLSVLVTVPATLLPVLPPLGQLPARLLRENPVLQNIAVVEFFNRLGRSWIFRKLHLRYPERIGLMNVVRRPSAFATTAVSVAGTVTIAACMYLFADAQDRGFQEFIDSQQWDALVKFNENEKDHTKLEYASIDQLLKKAGVIEWEPTYTAEGLVFSPHDRQAHSLVAYPADSPMRSKPNILRGRMPGTSEAMEIAIDLRAANRFLADLGDTIQVQYRERIFTFKIVGIMNAWSINQSFMTPQTLEQVTGEPLRITSAILKGLPGGSDPSDQVRAGEREAFLAQLTRQDPVSMAMPVYLIKTSAVGANHVLTFFINMYGHLGSIMGVILILVILSLNVTDRSSEYALLRGFGLGQSELFRSLIIEVSLIATAAAVFAYPMTQLATWLFQQRIQRVAVWVPIDHSIMAWAILVAPAFALLLLGTFPALKMVLKESEASILRARIAG